MEQSNIQVLIDTLDPIHPLKNEKNEIYRNALVNNLLQILKLDTTKLKTLLCSDESYSKYKYNQGFSELLLYILFSQNKLSFQCEKKRNTSNNCDVDIVLEYKGITYNFEVKSPEYNEHADGTLNGGLAFRFGDKETNDIQLTQLENQLRQGISKIGYLKVERSKITDNKIKDCLLSAQEKFTDPSETNCNILFINTITAEMLLYWQYIVNEATGFFNPFSNVGSFLDSDSKPISRQNYNKVNAIILSNAVTLNERRENDSWNLGKAINIVLMNPAAKKHCIYGLQILSEFFPHKTYEFAKMLFENHRKDPEIPELCFAYTFVSENGFNINEEKQRKGK